MMRVEMLIKMAIVPLTMDITIATEIPCAAYSDYSNENVPISEFSKTLDYIRLSRYIDYWWW